MRLLKLLAFIPLLWALTLPPAAQAADVRNIGVCNFAGLDNIQGFSTTQTGQALQQEIADVKTSMEDTYSVSYSQETSKCGEKNESTGLVERGDCEGKVVTEVNEIVTSTKPENSNDDKIVDVYQSICCLLGSEDFTTCYETRTYYTATLQECKDVENVNGNLAISNCQLRQWIIASTGMGLLKLYVKQIFTFGAFAVGAIALATIIINGIRISVAGVSGDISDAKQKITQSLSGIVLLFFAALILYAINPDFFG